MLTADIPTFRKPIRATWSIEDGLVALLCIALASLFIEFQLHIGGKIRLFDIIGFPAALAYIVYSVFARRLRFSFNLLVISAFFAILAFGGLKLGKQTFVREGLQGVEMVVFAWAMSLAAPRFNWNAVKLYFFLYAIGMIAYVVIWHISHGYLTGWKELEASKTMFNFGLPIIFGYMIFAKRQATILEYAGIAVLGVILIFSGERKAQIAYLICVGLAIYGGYLNVLVAAAGGAMMAIALSAAIIANPYLIRQFTSLTEGSGVKNMTLAQLVMNEEGNSPSDLQREFVNRLSVPLVKQHPLFGVGTDGFLPYLSDAWGPYLPEYMRLGIHGEFQRTLVENGFVGLFIYCIPWFRSLLWLLLNRRNLSHRGAVAYLMVMIVVFISNYYEGGGQRAFVAFIIIALLPEFFGRNIKRVRIRDVMRRLSTPPSGQAPAGLTGRRP